MVDLVTVTPRTVLLIDDDAAIRDALTELLVDEGFVVHCTVNGREALDWLHQAADPPDAILLDLMMPVMDGRTLLRHRKAEPLLRRIPLLVFSADRTCSDLTDDPDIDGILEAGRGGRPARRDRPVHLGPPRDRSSRAAIAIWRVRSAKRVRRPIVSSQNVRWLGDASKEFERDYLVPTLTRFEGETLKAPESLESHGRIHGDARSQRRRRRRDARGKCLVPSPGSRGRTDVCV